MIFKLGNIFGIIFFGFVFGIREYFLKFVIFFFFCKKFLLSNNFLFIFFVGMFKIVNMVLEKIVGFFKFCLYFWLCCVNCFVVVDLMVMVG